MKSIHHRFLAGAYYPLKFAKNIFCSLDLASPHSLRVLLYHDIAPQDHANFASQLRWLSRYWNFVSPEEFAALKSGEKPIRGRNLLLTFDDGFASNRVVAEKILNPMGIRALFFVVSEFVDLEDREEARQFIARHIQPGTPVDDLPLHLYNMGWSDLEVLIEQGHCLGGHTRTHARLSQVKTEVDLKLEIIMSADTLSQRLGVPIDHFAFTFGDLASFSKEALEVAKSRFRFIYSGLRGENTGSLSPFALRRDAVNAQDSTHLVAAFLEGFSDFHYAQSRAEFSDWL